jgi:putative copper export protein
MSTRVAAMSGALLVAASFTATGHTVASGHRWILAALLLVHLLVIEFWFGALRPLMLITRDAPAAAAVTVQHFSRFATLLVPLILVAGLGMAWVLIPSLQVFREPYGQLLLAKTAGFAALLALAALNKWRLAPALEAGDLAAARAFQWSAGTEYVLIAIVLAITAVMTSFFSPEA